MEAFNRILCRNLKGCRKFVITQAISRRSIQLQLFQGKNLSTSMSEVGPDLLHARPYNEVPRPKNFLNINWDVVKNPLGLADHIEKRVKSYGKIYKEKGFPGLPELLFIVDPKDIEKVYRAGDKDYPQRFQIPEWTQSRDELHLPYGMFLENNKEWLKQRIPISKYVMMPRKMADYWLPFNDVSLDLVKYIQNHRGEANVMSDTITVMNKWSFESVSLFVLGKRLGCLDDPVPSDCKEFIDSVQGFLSTTNVLLTSVPLHKFMRTKKWKELVHHLKTISSFASDLVQAKIEEIEKDSMKEEQEEDDVGDDFLSHMIYSGKMDVKEIAVNAIDLLTAGVDTTSVTTGSCLYSLATNHNVQEKLRKEVLDVVGKESRVTPEHVQNMHYLRDCIKETQRLYPIAPSNARVLREDIVLSGYRIPAGVPIVMPTVVCGRLSDNFPEPEKFKPERWNRESEDHPHPFASLPFGFGRRMCVGRRVAELEMHIVLAQLMRNFNINFTEDKPLKYVVNLFYYPERKMNLTFTDL